VKWNIDNVVGLVMQDCHQLYVAMKKTHEEVFDLKWEGIGIYDIFIQLLSIVMKNCNGMFHFMSPICMF
jgi:hypothetical protein